MQQEQRHTQPPNKLLQEKGEGRPGKLGFASLPSLFLPRRVFKECLIYLYLLWLIPIHRLLFTPIFSVRRLVHLLQARRAENAVVSVHLANEPLLPLCVLVGPRTCSAFLCITGIVSKGVDAMLVQLGADRIFYQLTEATWVAQLRPLESVCEKHFARDKLLYQFQQGCPGSV